MKLAMKIAAGAGLGALFAAIPALAQAPAAAAPVVPTDAMVNKGDVSWMLVSAALVL
ncbi:ammonia channel protein, partial [Escherichia coli]|nr:ammonia channel protein [Escherichia coli]